MRVYSAKLKKTIEVASPYITQVEAEALGLTVGSRTYACANSGSDLPVFHPGDEKIQPHIHTMVDNGSSMCYTSTKCGICGATYTCDSSD